jgi:sugar phosphate isomerase/epimerase
LIHNYFPPPEKDFVLNIASQNNSEREKSIDFAKTSIHAATQLGISFYAMHAGYLINMKPPKLKDDHFVIVQSKMMDREEGEKRMFDSFVQINDFAREKNVRVALENLFPIESFPECSLLTKPDDIFKFLDRFDDDENIGLLLDLGHLLISSNYFGFDKDQFLNMLFESYGNKVFAIHISGNDGKMDLHCQLNKDSWQLKAFKDINLNGIPVTLELRNLSKDIILDQYNLVENGLGI